MVSCSGFKAENQAYMDSVGNIIMWSEDPWIIACLLSKESQIRQRHWIFGHVLFMVEKGLTCI